jgi:hypothetical protein
MGQSAEGAMPGKEIRTKRHKVKRDTKRGYIPSSIPDPNIRVANAAEYAAYQLGHISQKLDKLIAAVQSVAARP